MKFSCSHCGQNLEAGEEWLGHATDCPTCGERFVVSATAKPRTIAAVPPVHSLSQPASSLLTPAKRGGGAGFGTIMWVLIFLAFGTFSYAMVRLDESPQQVWKRLIDCMHRVAHSRVTPASTSMHSDGLKFSVS